MSRFICLRTEHLVKLPHSPQGAVSLCLVCEGMIVGVRLSVRKVLGSIPPVNTAWPLCATCIAPASTLMPRTRSRGSSLWINASPEWGNSDHSEVRLWGVCTYTGAEVIRTKDHPVVMKASARGEPTNLLTHLLFTQTHTHTHAHTHTHTRT